jgi:hypothetical protein
MACHTWEALYGAARPRTTNDREWVANVFPDKEELLGVCDYADEIEPQDITLGGTEMP